VGGAEKMPLFLEKRHMILQEAEKFSMTFDKLFCTGENAFARDTSA